MNDRRQQWFVFYEAALTGSAGQGPCASMGEEDARVVSVNASRIADAAMARLDARDFPPTKVAALVRAADAVWSEAVLTGKVCVVDEQIHDALGKALADLKADQ